MTSTKGEAPGLLRSLGFGLGVSTAIGLARLGDALVIARVDASCEPVAAVRRGPRRFADAIASAGLWWPARVALHIEPVATGAWDQALDLAVVCAVLEASGQLDASGLSDVALVGALRFGGYFGPLGTLAGRAEEAAEHSGLRDVVVARPGQRFVDVIGAIGAIGPVACWR